MGDLTDINVDNIGELAFIMGLTLLIFWGTSIFTDLSGILIAGLLLFCLGIFLKVISKMRIERYTIFQRKKEIDQGSLNEWGYMIKDKL